MAAAPQSGIAFRIAAAALAGAPLGFAGGALLGGRLLADPAHAQAAATVIACALSGALLVGGLMALSAILLTPRTARTVTLASGVASAAVVVYLVQDFVGDRMAQARAFDAAYERLPDFNLEIAADNPNRSPFSELQYSSNERQYTAQRPGGWLCQGQATRAQTMALFQAMAAMPTTPTKNTATPSANCQLHANWHHGDTAAETCLNADHEMLLAADEMIEATERRSSCQRLDNG